MSLKLSPRHTLQPSTPLSERLDGEPCVLLP
jgi:hypothetical protein